MYRFPSTKGFLPHAPRVEGGGGGAMYRGTSLMRNSVPPKDHHRALGIFLCRVLEGRCFLRARCPSL